MDLTANALLAIGARPLMSSALPEMEQIAQVADALLINIGTLDDSLLDAAIVAGQTMRGLGKPVVLDPVGVQISSYRIEAALRIINACAPCVVKGNAQEMEALADKVVASPDCVLVTTGAVDVVTDGVRTQRMYGGSPLMTQVTAMGCTAGALIAAKAAKEKDPFVAACHAMQMMKAAGEKAVTDLGLGTYRQRFIDCLSAYV